MKTNIFSQASSDSIKRIVDIRLRLDSVHPTSNTLQLVLYPVAYYSRVSMVTSLKFQKQNHHWNRNRGSANITTALNRHKSLGKTQLNKK